MAQAKAMAAVLVAAALLAACGQPAKFEAAQFADPGAVQKNAETYWKRDGWWGGMPRDVKKVAVTQFAVEFVTENVNKSGADAISVLGVMEMAGVGRRKRVFSEQFKEEYPTELYNQFVVALKTEGFEVVGMEELTRLPAYATAKVDNRAVDSSQAGRNLLGGINRKEAAGIEAFPPRGLPLFDDSMFNVAGNVQAEGMMIGDSGAQAGLRVRLRVALDDDGRAVLDKGSTIRVSYGMAKENWRNKGPEWVAKERGAVISQAAFRDDVPVITSKEFQAFQGDVYTIDAAKYRESIGKMIGPFARMGVVRLKG